MISGMTVFSYPTMPGNKSSPEASIRRKLSRSSCLTDFETQPLWRKSRKFGGAMSCGVGHAWLACRGST